jgi:RNA polymerase sigma-70 factor (ECF subfamily)
MAAVQDGDQAAYEALLRQLLPALRGFVTARLGDRSSVEDVVQNVLLSVHRARHTYRPERRFEPWFWTIARNAITDSQRARTTRLRREEPLDDADVAVSPEMAIEAGLPLSAGLERALAKLPKNQRHAVELLHVHQLSVAEAAARVGVTPGALKVRAHRGYRALRVILEGLPD